MNMKTRFLILLCVFFNPVIAEEASLSLTTMLKARGLDAIDHIKALSEDLKQLKNDSPVIRSLKLKIAVEKAYANQVTMPSIVHKNGNGVDFYHLIIGSGDGEGFDVAFVVSKEGKLLGSRIDRMPSDWSIVLIVPGHVQILAGSDSAAPTIWFAIDDPFSLKVEQ